MSLVLLVFSFSFFIALFFYPILIKFLVNKQFVDKPNSRKVHLTPKPSIGGILFLPIALLSIWVFDKIDSLSANDIYLLLSCSLVVLVGFIDDLINLRARYKLFLFFPAIGFAILGVGIQLSSFHGLFGLHDIHPFIGIILTVFTIVSITNAFNLIDGIDGLAGSIGLLTTAILGVLIYLQGFHLHASILLGVSGVVLAFLIYNWSPSKVFMGDTGSLFLGFLITISLIRFIENHHIETVIPPINNPISFAISLIIIPFFDTIRVFSIRIINGRSPFDPDKNHFHHLLLKMGASHAIAAIILFLTTALFVLLAIGFSHKTDNTYFYWMFLLGAFASILLHYLAVGYSFAKKRKLVIERNQDRFLQKTKSYSKLNAEKVTIR